MLKLNISQQRFLIWLALSALLAAGFSYHTYLSYRQKHTEAQMLTRNLSYTYAVLTEHLLGDIDRFVTHAATLWFNGDQYQKAPIGPLLKTYRATEKHILDLLILDKNGKIVAWSGNGVVPNVDDRDYFQAHLGPNEDSFYIGSPQPSRVHPNRCFFSLSRAVYDLHGRLKGVGVAIIDCAALQKEYTTLLDAPQVSMALLYGEEGTFIVRAPPTNEPVIGQKAPSTAGLNLPLSETVSFILPRAVDGYKRFVTLRPVPGYRALSVSSTVRMDFVLKSWLPSALVLATLWAIISWAGWLASRRLTALQIREAAAKAQHEIERQKSEERYRLAAEQSGQIIYDYDPASGQVVWAGAIERLTGYDPKTFASFGVREWEAHLHPDDRQRMIAVLEQAELFDGTIDTAYRLRRKDGSYFDAEEHGAFFTDETGNRRRIGAIGDVSKFKEIERAREAFNRTLEERVYFEVGKRLELEHKKQEQEKILIQQSKMAAMGEMIGAIAHQWRQPLNALGLYIQDIEDAWRHNAIDEAYMRQAVVKSMRQIQFMSQTINDFRNFFKPDRTKRVFDIKAVAEHTSALVLPQLNAHGIELSFRLPDAPLLVEGYENELGQALLNLLSNAKDALEARKPHERQILITLGDAGGFARLCVSDNGDGVPSAILERIFEPYFTTKEEGKGTGIGLYMSKMIVEQHMEGKLIAQNTEAGARFCIELPLADRHET